MKIVTDIINTGPEILQVQLPKPFFNAFYRFLTAFLFLAYHNDSATYREHLIKGRDCITNGLRELMVSLAGESVDCREAVSPWLFLSKLCEQIHFEICQEPNFTDIDQIYQFRLQQLVSLTCHLFETPRILTTICKSNEVLYGHAPRSYQAKFSMLGQELHAVAVILDEQESICSQLLDSIRLRFHGETALLESSIERSPEIRLTLETLRRVRSKIDTIEELRRQNEDMRERVSNKIPA